MYAILFSHRGYEVQFHLLESKKLLDDPDTLSSPQYLLHQMPGRLPTMLETSESSLPRSFRIPYNNSALPNTLTIDEDLLHSALKPDATYYVVTVAIGKSNVSEDYCNPKARCSLKPAFHKSFCFGQPCCCIATRCTLGLL